MPRTRRKILIACGVAVSGVSGCLSISGSTPTPPRIGSLTVFNYDVEPHTLSVAVEREDGTTEYRETVEMQAGEPRDPEDASVETFPADPPGVILRAWVDSEPATAGAEYDLTEDEGCVEIIINIGSFGRPDDYAAVYSGNCI